MATLLVVLLIAGVGVLLDELIHAPLDRRGSSLFSHLLSSLGLYIVIVNVIALFYGSDTKVLRAGVQPTYELGGVILTRIQIAIVITAAVLFGALAIALRKTRLGRQLRALRDDPKLVQVMGINPRTLRWAVFGLGSALAGVAALLMGLDVGIDPHIGMAAILNGAVAVIIGGVGRFEGAALGGLLLGLLQSLVIWQSSSRWAEAVTFVVLILFLLFRPEGILGKRRRIEEAAA